jgi:ubiquinone/menaquinone biosynthesis C-methylase UbiE
MRINGRFLTLSLWLLAGPGLAIPPEQSVRPGVNSAYDNANVARWRGVFERDGREVWDRRHDIVRAIRLRPGTAMADIGAGTGFFSLLFAEAVGPKGRVYAVDITRNFVESIRVRAKGLGLKQVTGLVNTAKSTLLPAHSVDVVFISDTYHHFEYPSSMLASIHAALRPNGEMVVVDFKRIPGLSHPWVLDHVRAGEDSVIQEIRAAGFELIERQDFMQTQYYLRFRKR